MCARPMDILRAPDSPDDGQLLRLRAGLCLRRLWQPNDRAVALADASSGIVSPGHWGCVWRPPGANETPGAGPALERRKKSTGDLRSCPLVQPPRTASERLLLPRRPPGAIEARELPGGSGLVLLRSRDASGRSCTPRLGSATSWPLRCAGPCSNWSWS